MKNRQPSVLLVAAKWWPLSARLAIGLMSSGCRVSAVCPAGHPLTHVEGIERIDRYRGTDSLPGLCQSLKECRPDVVVPCDDGVVAQLHALCIQEPALRELIERSLGPADRHSITGNRYRLLSTAKELGLPIPRTSRVSSTKDLVEWHRQVAPAGVLKVDGTSGGVGVRICESVEKSLAAWHELTARGTAVTAWKRLVIDRDPLALWAHGTQAEPEVTIQEFIPGRPANLMMACWQGQVLGCVSVAVVASDGAAGAATIVRRIEDEAMKRAARLLATELQLTGFYGLDFMIDAHSGTPHLIEMNPRCTQLGHLEFADQASLAAAFAAALSGVAQPRPEHPIQGDTIAFFPQALARGVSSTIIGSSHHDVPWGHSKLVRELLLDPWPQRRWGSRLYHALRPIRRFEPVAFDIG